MTRSLSFSELSKAQTCQAQWDFAYGGHLAGSALKAKATAPLLSQGRAWGAAIAAWDATRQGALSNDRVGYAEAVAALDASLEEDAERQREFGVHDPQHTADTRNHLVAILSHHVTIAEPLAIERLEEEIEVPIPSRTGRRGSTRYRFLARFDGVTVESPYGPGHWLVEYKLRGQLQSVRLITRSRQMRWYAWAWQRKYGIPVYGVIVAERLNQPPKPARLVQSKKRDESMTVSHAVDQLTTPGRYLDACREFDVEPQPETVLALEARRWHQRVPISFRPGELDEAGRELVSGAKLIQALDSGDIFPVRNVRPANCNGCFFRDICDDPMAELVDALYERTVPKRDRQPETEEEQVGAGA